MPRIADEYLASVVFLHPPGQHDDGGTGFLLGVPAERLGRGWVHHYIVTAAHVIDSCGGTPDIRLNTKTGKAESLRTDGGVWLRHPHYDVAVAHITFGADSALYEMGHIGSDSVLSEQRFKSELRVGIGDDVFMVGRYLGMNPSGRNVPVLRAGTIAAMGRADHPFEIQDVGPQREAFLVDMRARSGFSGSLVILNRLESAMRTIIHRYGEEPRSEAFPVGAGIIGVECAFVRDIGEVWRHGRAPDGSEDEQEEGLYTLESTGLSVVVPSWAILDLLNREEAVNQRTKDEDDVLSERQRHKGRVTPASRPGPKPERLHSDETLDELAKRVMDAGKPDESDED